MREVLINNYNACMPDNGICYFLGDQGMTSAEYLNRAIKRLRGTKVLIIGNHDKGINSMYSAGFDAVLHGAILYIANERVSLSHCPLIGVYREDTSKMKGGNGDNWHGEKRPKHKMLTFKDEGQFHLHGHIHAPNGGRSKKTLSRQYDVGVDANNFRPVSISQIEQWMAQVKREESGQD